jgi:xylulokinase/glycerol kinase
MLWLKQERAEVYSNAYKLIGVQDFVIYLLTNNFVTDWTQAARTMLLNINTFEWDEELIGITGVDKEKLCELKKPGSIAGGLSAEISHITGLKAGIPVIMTGGDQQSAALALNVLRPGFAEANTGTGSFVIAYSEKPVFDDYCRTLCSAAAVPGKWIAEAGILTTGTIYRWLKEEFYKDVQTKEGFEALNMEAKDVPIGANGVMVLPHFEGSAAPYWNPSAKGMFFNLSLGTKRGDIARAVLEGISLEIAENIVLIENLVGRIEMISVAGGLTNLELFNQIQADTSDKVVIRYENNEASSLGALISASVTLGVYLNYEEAFRRITTVEPVKVPPVNENTIKYKSLMVRKKKLYEALNEMEIYNIFKSAL